MKSPQPRRIEVPEVVEVFVDELRCMTFDGHQLRLEFDVLRKDAAAPEDDSRRWVQTASRIVISAHGVPALLDQMARLRAALAARGAPTTAEPLLHWKGRETGLRN